MSVDKTSFRVDFPNLQEHNPPDISILEPYRRSPWTRSKNSPGPAS
jgi:hypothetical protein